MSTKIIFLGGIFLKEHSSFIHENSIGPIQNAADALQKNLILGIASNANIELTVVNLPYIGSYPNRFKKICFPFNNISKLHGATIASVRFNNLLFFKHISRTISSLRSLFKITDDRNNIIIVYAVHLPFLIASLLIKLIRPSIKLCLIIPDLPEFMGGEGVLRFFTRQINKFTSRPLLKRFDYFVVLTSAMAHRLNLRPNSSIVIEGVATEISAQVSLDFVESKSHTRSILYTGTLDKRYGILELIRSFDYLKRNDVELWICGDGDAKSFVIESAKKNSRIIYYGQLSRERTLLLQQKATILINPRTPDDEFTKYSFPSKILEYMSSGRPVIMHKLTGIPDEYYDYTITPINSDTVSLSACIENTLSLSDQDLDQIGNKARNFVQIQKNPKSQASKILNFISSR